MERRREGDQKGRETLDAGRASPLFEDLVVVAFW